MPIDSSGYTPNSGNTSWQSRKSGQHQGSNKVASQHAERQVWTALPAATVYLIVQNAFPCYQCHAYFLGQAANHSFIIKVTANEGKYSADHGLGMNASVPQILYYHAGACKYVGLFSGANSGPPNGFPAHPDFTDVG